MLKQKNETAENNGPKMYSFKFNGRVYYVNVPVIPVQFIYDLAGLQERVYEITESLSYCYEITNDGSCKRMIMLRKPSVGNVHYGEWAMSEFVSESYIEAKLKPSMSDTSKRLSSEDSKFLKELGITCQQ